MLIFLTSLFATLNNAVLDLPFPCCPGLENLALRHHSGVLRRSARKRPKLTSGDRLLWICLSRLWRDWLSAMAIVKPETVVAWLRRFWRWKVRRGQPGRPLLSREVRGSDPQDGPGESQLGRSLHPWRTAQTRHRHRGEQRQQIHAALPQAAVSGLAHISGEREAAGLHRLLHGAHDPFPDGMRRFFTCFSFWPMTAVASCTSM